MYEQNQEREQCELKSKAARDLARRLQHTSSAFDDGTIGASDSVESSARARRRMERSCNEDTMTRMAAGIVGQDHGMANGPIVARKDQRQVGLQSWEADEAMEVNMKFETLGIGVREEQGSDGGEHSHTGSNAKVQRVDTSTSPVDVCLGHCPVQAPLPSLDTGIPGHEDGEGKECKPAGDERIEQHVHAISADAGEGVKEEQMEPEAPGTRDDKIAGGCSADSIQHWRDNCQEQKGTRPEERKACQVDLSCMGKGCGEGPGVVGNASAVPLSSDRARAMMEVITDILRKGAVTCHRSAVMQVV